MLAELPNCLVPDSTVAEPAVNAYKPDADVTRALVKLAREIGDPKRSVGYGAFLLFALMEQLQPTLWEGDNRINLIETYCPWASVICLRSPVVQGVCCCLVPRSSGHAEMAPVSGEHPLHSCNHYVACLPTGADLDEGGSTLETYYGPQGLALLSTVADGDCGVDVMLQMANLENTEGT